jgi:hypothetical protein
MAVLMDSSWVFVKLPSSTEILSKMVLYFFRTSDRSVSFNLELDTSMLPDKSIAEFSLSDILGSDFDDKK